MPGYANGIDLYVVRRSLYVVCIMRKAGVLLMFLLFIV